MLNLQEPIRDGAGLLVRVLNVGLGDGEVGVDHLEAGMAQQALEGKDVAPVAQKLDGKGVAEAVDGGVWHASAGSDVEDDAAQGVAREGLAVEGDEKEVVVFRLVAGGTVAPEVLCGVGAERGDGSVVRGPWAVVESWDSLLGCPGMARGGCGLGFLQYRPYGFANLDRFSEL